MKIGLSEILKRISILPTKEEKIKALKVNDTIPLRNVYYLAFHPDIVWLLPQTDPPYTPCINHDQENRLYQELRKMDIFLKNGRGDSIKPLKREMLFISILESVAPEDAKLLLCMKNKSLPYDITYDLVKEAYPELLP